MTEAEETIQDKLSDVYNTQQHQRSLLRKLFTHPFDSRKYISAITENMMESAERRWLLRTAQRVFKESSALLTEAIFTTELENAKILTEEVDDRLTKKKVKRVVSMMSHMTIKTEWHLVMSSSQEEPTEWLIETIAKQQKAKELINAASRCLETLQHGDVYGAIQSLGSDVVKMRGGMAKSRPVREFTDIDWRVELIKNKKEHPENYAGIKCGIPVIDRETGGFFRGELTLVSLHVGVGKSTIIRNVISGMLANNANVLLVANEEVEEQVCSHFDSMITRIHYNDFKRGVISDENIAKWKDKIAQFKQTHGRLFVQEIAQFTTVAEIEKTLVELQQQGIKIDAVALDYLDHLKPMERAWGEIDGENKAIAELKGVGIAFRCAVITATQADTKSQENKEDSEPNAYNVRGSKQKSGAANVVLFGRRANFEEGATETDLEVICVKNRDGALFRTWLRVHNATGTLSEIPRPRSSSQRSEDDSKIRSGKKELTQPPKPPVRQAVQKTPITKTDVDAMSALADDPDSEGA